MPNRILKESITTSDTLDRLTAEEERCFYRLIVVCDDYGRFDARPEVIIGRCFTLKISQIKPSEITRMLHKLAEVGLIRLYTVDGKPYLEMATWDKHQQVRAKRSKYPHPPTDDGTCNQLIADDSECNQAIANVPVIQSNPIQSNTNPITSASAESAHISEVFDYYRERIQSGAKLTDQSRRKVAARLKEFTVEEIKVGMDHFSQDGFSMDNNASRGLAWWCHSEDRVLGYINMTPKPSAPTPTATAEPAFGRKTIIEGW